jgi:uncharacterized membrane protein YgaE (UPF0421/DUF939 family)
MIIAHLQKRLYPVFFALLCLFLSSCTSDRDYLSIFHLAFGVTIGIVVLMVLFAWFRTKRKSTTTVEPPTPNRETRGY